MTCLDIPYYFHGWWQNVSCNVPHTHHISSMDHVFFLLPCCNSYSLVVPSLCSCCVAPLHLFCLYMWILGSSLILNFPCFSWLKVVVESSSFQGCPDKQPTSNCRVTINQSEKCHLFMHCRVAIDDTDTYTCYLYFCVLLCCDRGRLHIKRRELKI